METYYKPHSGLQTLGPVRQNNDRGPPVVTTSPTPIDVPISQLLADIYKCLDGLVSTGFIVLLLPTLQLLAMPQVSLMAHLVDLHY